MDKKEVAIALDVEMNHYDMKKQGKIPNYKKNLNKKHIIDITLLLY